MLSSNLNAILILMDVIESIIVVGMCRFDT